MDRASFLKSAALSLVGLPMGGSSVEPAGVMEARPNIVFIISDDQHFRTANKDDMPLTHAALAALGTSFSRAYCAVPRCGPDRAAMFTGLYPEDPKNNIPGNPVRVNAGAAKLFRDRGFFRSWLPRRLNVERGYRLGLFGKVLNDYGKIPGYVPPGMTGWVSPFTLAEDPVKANAWGRMKRMPYGPAGETRELAERSVYFLGRANEAHEQSGEPFFLAYTPQAPHKPATPSLANKDAYAGAIMPRPPNFNPETPDPNKPKEVRERPRMTDAQVSAMQGQWRGTMGEIRDLDGGIKRVLDAIDWETTYVFCLTDNSTLWGHHRMGEGETAKSLPYEEASRTYLWVRGPAVAENAVVDDLVSTVDLATTAYELAGLDDLAAETSGRSMLPALVGTEGRERRSSLRIDLPPDPDPKKDFEGWTAIRTETALYCEHGTGESELYDMDPASPQYDPYQLRSLQRDRPEQAAELSRRLQSLSSASGDGLRSAGTSS